MVTIQKKLKTGLYFTDIHWGKKANSELHNQDCMRFIDWFCSRVRELDVDYIAFLGDWNENRSALNIATLNYSYHGAKKLNDLGLPVYFVVGNHDLYHRHSREIHSIVPFNEFKNFTVIDQPKIIKEIMNDVLFVPYIFYDEYPSLTQYFNIPFWGGHFEFKGFEVTGYGMKLPSGPDPVDFKNGPKYIVSGHFHKRQANENIIYIGNTFPMDFSDAGDFSRGLMLFEHDSQKMTFENWKDCPKYIKTKLSDILDTSIILHSESRVKCIVDIPISFEESNYLKKKLTEKHKLRELVLEETSEIKESLVNTETKIDWNTNKLSSIDELVQQMLKEIDNEHINNQKLIEIYQTLKT